jgi:CubicO group peptidase (beta-lactamase class C family)
MQHIDHEVRGLADAIEQIVTDEGLSGTVRIDRSGDVVFECATGLAHRGLGVPNSTETQFGIASGTKGLTALTVMTLVERDEIRLDTTARSLLGSDLPLIDDRVTVEQLLAHRSGIGDFLDEDVFTDSDQYVMPVSGHELATTEDYLQRALGGHPTKFAPDERFSYSNGGYVVLALLAERATGTLFHELVDERVCAPAGMSDTGFLRSDELPGRAAVGYIDDDGLRTNVFHLPVRGSGDGGVYTTTADVHALWDAFTGGRIVAPETVEEMLRPRSEIPEDSTRYGLGFWIDARTNLVSIHGFDAGVGFVSVHDRQRHITHTVISNKSRGAWPVSQRIDENLGAWV